MTRILRLVLSLSAVAERSAEWITAVRMKPEP